MKTLALFASLTLAAAAASRREHTTLFLRGGDKVDPPPAGEGGVDGAPVNVPDPNEFPKGTAAVPYVDFPTCAKDQERCTVLVVVDMQKDYCQGCGSPTESQWASKGVKEIATPINAVIDAAGDNLDLVLFTQDYLPDDSKFLVHNSVGSEVLDEL